MFRFAHIYFPTWFTASIEIISSVSIVSIVANVAIVGDRTFEGFREEGSTPQGDGSYKPRLHLLFGGWALFVFVASLAPMLDILHFLCFFANDVSIDTHWVRELESKCMFDKYASTPSFYLSCHATAFRRFVFVRVLAFAVWTQVISRARTCMQIWQSDTTGIMPRRSSTKAIVCLCQRNTLVRRRYFLRRSELRWSSCHRIKPPCRRQNKTSSTGCQRWDAAHTRVQ